jgi:hypothetical protein
LLYIYKGGNKATNDNSLGNILSEEEENNTTNEKGGINNKGVVKIVKRRGYNQGEISSASKEILSRGHGWAPKAKTPSPLCIHFDVCVNLQAMDRQWYKTMTTDSGGYLHNKKCSNDGKPTINGNVCNKGYFQSET